MKERRVKVQACMIAETAAELRLRGNWVRRAGFNVGSHATIKNPAPGLIIIEQDGAVKVPEVGQEAVQVDGKLHETTLGEFQARSIRPVLWGEIIDNPERCANYHKGQIQTSQNYNPDVESFAVLCVNTRHRVIGHTIISTGTLDTLLVHPLSVFRPAIAANAAAIILFHNHPSGDPTPSEADIKVTRDLVRAGQLLKVQVLDHVIMGHASPDGGRGYHSLRELGYFNF